MQSMGVSSLIYNAKHACKYEAFFEQTSRVIFSRFSSTPEQPPAGRGRGAMAAGRFGRYVTSDLLQLEDFWNIQLFCLKLQCLCDPDAYPLVSVHTHIPQIPTAASPVGLRVSMSQCTLLLPLHALEHLHVMPEWACLTWQSATRSSWWFNSVSKLSSSRGRS